MDQVVVLAIVTVVVILVIVGAVRVMGPRPRPTNTFGAGGTTSVPPGTRGIVKTPLTPSGVVNAAGEDWTARTADWTTIAAGVHVHVVGQDGLTLLVESDAPAIETEV
jgi:membrane protein implicated in regulation of membrane protease activity